jgi:3-hydroxybutyryl-CoA dehydratase
VTSENEITRHPWNANIELRIGDKMTELLQIDIKKGSNFCKLTGDTNPIHKSPIAIRQVKRLFDKKIQYYTSKQESSSINATKSEPQSSLNESSKDDNNNENNNNNLIDTTKLFQLHNVVPGMLSAAQFARLFGSRLPGCIYSSQTLQFMRPIFYDDEILILIVVKEILLNRKKVVCTTEIKKKSIINHTTSTVGWKTAVKGEATVMIPRLIPDKRQEKKQDLTIDKNSTKATNNDASISEKSDPLEASSKDANSSIDCGFIATGEQEQQQGNEDNHSRDNDAIKHEATSDESASDAALELHDAITSFARKHANELNQEDAKNPSTDSAQTDIASSSRMASQSSKPKTKRAPNSRSSIAKSKSKPKPKVSKLDEMEDSDLASTRASSA